MLQSGKNTTNDRWNGWDFVGRAATRIFYKGLVTLQPSKSLVSGGSIGGNLHSSVGHNCDN